MDEEFWFCFFEMGVLLTTEIIDQLESSTVILFDDACDTDHQQIGSSTSACDHNPPLPGPILNASRIVTHANRGLLIRPTSFPSSPGHTIRLGLYVLGYLDSLETLDALRTLVIARPGVEGHHLVGLIGRLPKSDVYAFDGTES